MLLYALLLLTPLIHAGAEITVLGQIPLGQVTSSTATASGTAAATTATVAAYDTTVLDPPAVPNPLPSMAFTLELQNANTSVSGLSITQSGGFLGFSIEMSVATQVIGRNSTVIYPIFLNLMSQIISRAGFARIRVGGNTQDFAYYTETIPDSDGKCLGKESVDNSNPTETPSVIFNEDFFYMLSNISALANIGWYLGIPFNDTDWRLPIVQFSESIIGDRLFGLQAANEPDLYVDHGHRDTGYNATSYYDEVGNLIETLSSASLLTNNLIGPNIATGDWEPADVWDTGFITTYASNLVALSVEHYPTDNCYAEYGIGSPVDYQTEFSAYLNHTAAQSIVSPYLASTVLAVAADIPFMMLETNSASCGGFPGISDSFGATLWALDYGLQMAYSNFSGALLHLGGQNVYYNPFIAPPTNESTFHQWTVGAVFYSAVVIAETLGSSNTSQVLDLQGNDGSMYTPQYAIYEQGTLGKVALFNYITDASGASDYTATIQLTGTTVPASVQVKYLLSESVSTKDNITWAGQTFGTVYEVDGILKNDLSVTTVNCDQTANTCAVTVPAPGFALVFMTEDVYTEDSPTTVETYSTTTYTKTANTVTIASSVLATSNGHSGVDREELGSTSKGSSGAMKVTAGLGIFGSIILGALVLIIPTMH